MNGFKDALKNTRRNQHYRDNQRELDAIDLRMSNKLDKFSSGERNRNNLLNLLGSTSLLAGTIGSNLTEWDKSRQYALDQGLESGGWKNMLNPFKKGGFGETFSNQNKPDAPAFTIQDLGNIKNLSDWSKAYMPKNPLDFDAASTVSTADNPMLSLLQLYNAQFNKGKSSFNEKMNAGSSSENQSVHPLAHLQEGMVY